MAPSAPEPPPTSDARLRAAFAIDSDVLDVAVTDRVTRAGDLAVKSFGPEQIPRARLEAAVLSHLHQAAASNLLEEILGTGYRVPSIVRTRTDDDLHVDGRGALLATRWEAGVHRAWADIPLDGWWALGASLGALHRRLDEPGAPPPPSASATACAPAASAPSAISSSPTAPTPPAATTPRPPRPSACSTRASACSTPAR